MTKEVLKLALEALERLKENFAADQHEWEIADVAITAIKEALREHAMREVQRLGQEIEQEPVCPDCKAKVLYECVACSSNNYPPKTEQEPVAMWDGKYQIEFGNLSAYKHGEHSWIPLYNTPPQRTWVGLTDEDWDEIFGNALTIGETIKVTEAKLKEKNNA